MGLFVRDDGHFHGWLSALLCCFGAVADDEAPVNRAKEKNNDVENQHSRPSTLSQQPSQQQLPLTALPAISSSQLQEQNARYAEADEDSAPHHGRRVSDQPPLLEPLRLGRDDPRRSDNATLSTHSTQRGLRPSASVPYLIRDFDPLTGMRRNLVPLRLGPVVLSDLPPAQENPLPQMRSHHFPNSHANTSPSLLQEAMLGSYGDHYLYTRRNKTLVDLTTSESNGMIELEGSPVPRRRPAIQHAQSTHGQHYSTAGEDPFSVRSHNTSERDAYTSIPFKRSATLQTKRRSCTVSANGVLDREILELNRAVGERRAEAQRESQTGGQHVPAVAPAMHVDARSETLEGIGSALSRPLTVNQSLVTCVSGDWDFPNERTPKRRSRASTRASAIVSGWMTNVFPSSSTGHLPTAEDFYQCRPPLPSQPADYDDLPSPATVTEAGSPSLTAASSPTSAGPSRTATNDEESGPSSPHTLYAYPRTGAKAYGGERQGPVVVRPSSQVGVAL